VIPFRIPYKIKSLAAVGVIVLIWIGCTYEPLSPPAMPTYYQTINLPLTDVTLYLSDLVDTTNHIFGDSVSDLISFKFNGELDTVTLTEDIFVIPTATSVTFQQDFSNLGEQNQPVSIAVPMTVKLSTLFGLPLPADYPIRLDSLPRVKLMDSKSSYKIFDKNGVPYFERVDYLTIGEGTFASTIENQMLMDLDSVNIQLCNSDNSLIAENFYPMIPAGETSSQSDDLDNKMISDSITIAISAILAGSNGQPIIIPAGSDPYLTITVNMEINDIESFTGKPLPMIQRIAQPLPESNMRIYRGIFGEAITQSSDTNQINWQIENDLPLNLKMELEFQNFYTETGEFKISSILNSGAIDDNFKRLDLDTLRNPDPTTVVDSFIVITTIEILDDPGDTVSTIPIDIEGQLGFSMTISNMKFQEISCKFNKSFNIPIPPLTIKDIPTGFGDVNFGNVFLTMHFYNEIQVQFDLGFDIEGRRAGRDETLHEAGTILAGEAEREKYSKVDLDIAPVFNLIPDSIIISGMASIPPNNISILRVNKKFWGQYEVEVPFIVKMNEMTFIPKKSNKLSAVDKTTRQRIRDGLIEASIISWVKNDFPISGEINVLISTHNYFPLEPGIADSGYVWNATNDTLYAITDSGLVKFTIDTLATIELPTPIINDTDFRVKTAGVVQRTSVIDSAKVEDLIGEEDHYIRPRVYFNSTDSLVTVGYYDQINIRTVFSLTLNTTAVVGSGGSEEEDTVTTESLEKIFSQSNPKESNGAKISY
jgi:hypothetical protein